MRGTVLIHLFLFSGKSHGLLGFVHTTGDLKEDRVVSTSWAVLREGYSIVLLFVKNGGDRCHIAASWSNVGFPKG